MNEHDEPGTVLVPKHVRRPNGDTSIGAIVDLERTLALSQGPDDSSDLHLISRAKRHIPSRSAASRGSGKSLEAGAPSCLVIGDQQSLGWRDDERRQPARDDDRLPVLGDNRKVPALRYAPAVIVEPEVVEENLVGPIQRNRTSACRADAGPRRIVRGYRRRVPSK